MSSADQTRSGSFITNDVIIFTPAATSVSCAMIMRIFAQRSRTTESLSAAFERDGASSAAFAAFAFAESLPTSRRGDVPPLIGLLPSSGPGDGPDFGWRSKFGSSRISRRISTAVTPNAELCSSVVPDTFAVIKLHQISRTSACN